jgi:DNA-binding response OmpR family regulator
VAGLVVALVLAGCATISTLGPGPGAALSAARGSRASAQHRAAPGTATVTGKSILVIDNDEALVDLEAFYFAERGYTVYTVLDGDAGVELAIRHRPAAIICDVVMGQMHGFEVLQALRARPELATTVVIMRSAKVYKPDITRAIELGATDYVVKPFRAADLAALVERRLTSRGGR